MSALIRSLTKDGLGTPEDRIRRYLAFAGIADNEVFEITAIGCRLHRKMVMTAYVRGIDVAVALLLGADFGPQYLGAQGLYILPNRLKGHVHGGAPLNTWRFGARTQDQDVDRWRIMYVDFDPLRPDKGNSTAEMLLQARDCAERVITRFESLGFGEYLGVGMSGNGFHVQIALDCSAEIETQNLVKKVLALAKAITVEAGVTSVDVDQSVTRAAQLGPAWGTWKRKADNAPGRPQRRTWFWAGGRTEQPRMAPRRAEAGRRKAGCFTLGSRARDVHGDRRGRAESPGTKARAKVCSAEPRLRRRGGWRRGPF